MEYRYKTFQQVVPGDYKILYRIHPMHQQDILSILNNLKQFKDIRVIIFGSVLTHYCDANSDIDIAIQVLKQPLTVPLRASIDEAIRTAIVTDCDYDLVWYNTLVNSPLKNEIDEFDKLINYYY